MMFKKIVYLVLALALPVSIFLFLKIFGKNQFEVEPFFKEGVVNVPEGCQQPPSGEYRVPIEILEQMAWTTNDALALYYFPESGSINKSPFVRIRENFMSTEIQIIEIINLSGVPDSISSSNIVRIPDTELTAMKNCYFFLTKPNDLVLVDNQRQIRGIYQLSNREEIDRLLMEASILLKEYNGE